MRIIIDLQGCQTGSAASMDATLALALNLARQAGAHHVQIALNGRLPDRIDHLRTTFSGVLPAGRVLVYDVPELPDMEPGARAWLEGVSQQLRAAFFAAQNADLVFAPNIADLPGLPTIAVASPLFDSYTYVIGTAAPELAYPLPTAPDLRLVHEHQQGALASAHQLLAPTQDVRARLLQCLPDADVAVLDMQDAAALWRHFEALAQRHAAARPAASAQRPRMAYVSPLPPEKSGISDYSAELLPQLARFYDITVIVDQPAVADGWVKTNLALHDPAWFDAHAHEFERVVYHFGNSVMHRHMFDMLERHPGVVVLHDFYFGHVLHTMHHTGYKTDALQNALYASHGFGAVMERDRIGENAAVWKFPGNKMVLDQAEGVIVHSDYPRKLAAEWYGPDMAAQWRTIPLLRGHAETGDRAAARRAARQALGLADDDIMVCTFGMLGPTKLNDKLLDAWLASPLAQDAKCRLVFVGDAGTGAYGRDFLARLNAVREPARRPVVTGFVDHKQYQAYLAASDVAVQLRSNTRGETSAAVLDCLLHGLPTVVNAHGSIAELPEQVLVKLADEFDTADLGAALERLRGDSALRQQLSQAAAHFIATEHAPEHVGELYRDAIEHYAQHSPKRTYARLLNAVNAVETVHQPSEADLILAAKSIARNLPVTPPRMMYVDISAMVHTDLKTGIQRVVRSILQSLLANPPAGYRVEPVYSPGGGQQYRYARRHMQSQLKTPVHDLDDAPIEVREGDMFVGLDLLMHLTYNNRHILQDYRTRGAHIYFVVYDLLPVQRPECFPFGAEADFARWLHTISQLSNGLLCISRAVADEMGDWLADNPAHRASRLHLGYFHLGADIENSAPSTGLPAGAEQILEQLASRPTFIMVGTVEPRKAHAQALAAFDVLWKQGVQANLVIVGKQGWQSDALATRLRSHGENGKRLFWLPGVSDEMLVKLYAASNALLAPSEGEGFGLPLIEAAQRGLPIVARDLPVFREVAGEHAFYFSGKEPEALATRLRAWLDLYAKGEAPTSTGMRWLTWNDSAEQFKQALFGQHWYRDISPAHAAASHTAQPEYEAAQ
ncbi:hypothetical protein GCM10027277_19350 [Pseudoduganella ginsengisoli]|uniref:Glycosyltransferase n=1 Tax=Pseudoduganella ginsengisoli TaxID=1462440 RepID=A0A6L6PUZ0_9BURK|nr:glycosyltransferase [Pseudoduganella ginsengisoli]MTW00808.1 glycosyltransferase [Pseudoduganella ginsengisoli]